MRSIFFGDYNGSVKRIDSLDPSKAPAGLKKNGNESFARILASLDPNNERVGSDENSAKMPAILTNFSSLEHERFLPGVGYSQSDDASNIGKKVEDNKITATSPPNLIDDLIGVTVNDTTCSVKDTPYVQQPRMRLDTSYEPTVAPAAPVVKSAQFAKAAPAPISYDPKDLPKIIGQASRVHGIDPALGLAVARAESSLNPNAISTDGKNSKGLFQLLDSTAQDMLGRINGADTDSSFDPFNPVHNSQLGVGYLRRLLDMFSSATDISPTLRSFPASSSSELEKLAVAAFNTGEGNVIEAQQKAVRAGKNPGTYNDIAAYLPSITQTYVKRVSEYKDSILKTTG